jgi:NADH-quinone oxidoreductase subunit J
VQDAPFLGVVQVVVYTGAVMMLFLFVLMLVGVDSGDSLVETLRGQRVAAALAALGFGALLIFSIGDAVVTNTGLDKANSDGNVQDLANLIFSRYVFAFEVTSALLITAALGAMILAHRERHEHRPNQRELSEQRFRGGVHPAPLPGPGVYARHNAVDTGAAPRRDPPTSRSHESSSPVATHCGTSPAPACELAVARGRTYEPDELRLPVGAAVLDRRRRRAFVATRSWSSCVSRNSCSAHEPGVRTSRMKETSTGGHRVLCHGRPPPRWSSNSHHRDHLPHAVGLGRQRLLSARAAPVTTISRRWPRGHRLGRRCSWRLLIALPLFGWSCS